MFHSRAFLGSDDQSYLWNSGIRDEREETKEGGTVESVLVDACTQLHDTFFLDTRQGVNGRGQPSHATQARVGNLTLLPSFPLRTAGNAVSPATSLAVASRQEENWL